MRKTVTWVLLGVLLATGSVRGSLSFNRSDDWDGGTNPYGTWSDWYDWGTGDMLTPRILSESSGGFITHNGYWQTRTSDYYTGANFEHTVWTEWTSPSAMTLNIDMTGSNALQWISNSSGTTMEVRIYKVVNNTFEDLTTTLTMAPGDGPKDVSIQNVSVSAGETIYFRFRALSWSDQWSEAWLGFNPTLTETPEPATMGLLGCGVLGLLRRRK